MNRTFVIFSVSELGLIDVPSCVLGLTTKGDYLTYEEILAVLSGPDWTQPMEP